MTAAVAFHLTWHIGRTGQQPTTGARSVDTEAEARMFLRELLDWVSGPSMSETGPQGWNVSAVLTTHPGTALPHLARRWDGTLSHVLAELDADDTAAAAPVPPVAEPGRSVALDWAILRNGTWMVGGEYRARTEAEALAYLDGILNLAQATDDGAATVQASASLVTWPAQAPRPLVHQPDHPAAGHRRREPARPLSTPPPDRRPRHAHHHPHPRRGNPDRRHRPRRRHQHGVEGLRVALVAHPDRLVRPPHP